MEEVLKKYFLHEIKEKPDMTEYKVLGTVKEKYLGHIIYLGTDKEAWVGEFTVALIPMASKNPVGNENDVLVLVSPECPEYYLVEREEILGMASEIVEENFEVTLDDIKTWTTKIAGEQLGSFDWSISPSPYTITTTSSPGIYSTYTTNDITC